jgi:hypothetical protein
MEKTSSFAGFFEQKFITLKNKQFLPAVVMTISSKLNTGIHANNTAIETMLLLTIQPI